MNRVFVLVLADNPIAAAISAHETLLTAAARFQSTQKTPNVRFGSRLNRSTQHKR